MSKTLKTDYSGQRFGKLTAMTPAEKVGGHPMWLCRCDCGKERSVRASSLKLGNTKSCGCLAVERNKELNTSHGLSHTPEYRAWLNMWDRCSNPKHKQYPDYKGRCPPEPWKVFEVFLKDMGSKTEEHFTLERVRNDLPYGPENCVWATPKDQTRNRSTNVWLEHGGRRMILSDWAKHLKVERTTLTQMLKSRSLKETIEYYERKNN